jgi:hypothetical protein
MEPDGPVANPFAIRAMAGLGLLPVLNARDPGSRDLVRLWDVAFGVRPARFVRGQGNVSKWLLRNASEEQRNSMCMPGGTVSSRLRVAAALGVPSHLKLRVPPANYVVKSVHAPLMIDWIRRRWQPEVVVCFRHPLDVVASALAMGFLGRSGPFVLGSLSRAARSIGTDQFGVAIPTSDNLVATVAWRVGLVMSVLAEQCRQNPTFHVVDHEQTCADPVGHFRELVTSVGLTWTPATEAFVLDSNKSGAGWETNRLASEQSQRWRSRLPLSDARAAANILNQFPIAAHYELDPNA